MLFSFNGFQIVLVGRAVYRAVVFDEELLTYYGTFQDCQENHYNDLVLILYWHYRKSSLILDNPALGILLGVRGLSYHTTVFWWFIDDRLTNLFP